MGIVRPPASQRDTKFVRDYSPTWPATVSKIGMSVMVLVTAAHMAVSRGLSLGGTIDQYMDLVLAGAAAFAVLFAVIALAFGFRYPSIRLGIIVTSVFSFGLIGYMAVTEVPGYLAAKNAAAEKERAERAFFTELQKISITDAPPVERVQKASKATYAAAGTAVSPRKERLEVIGIGLDRIATKLSAHGPAWDAVEKSGGIDPKGLKSKVAIEERRKLVQAAGVASRQLDSELEEVRREWREKVQEQEHPQSYAVLTATFINSLQKDLKKESALAAEMDLMLESLQKTFGQWSLNKEGALVFKSEVEARLHADRVQRLTDIRAEKPLPAAIAGAVTPGEGKAPASSTLDEAEARQYANSYITLIQRGHFDEAHKYLPPDVRASVTEKAHSDLWTAKAGEKREEISVDQVAEGVKIGIGFEVKIPQQKPEIVVVLKTDGKIYAAPQALLPKPKSK